MYGISHNTLSHTASHNIMWNNTGIYTLGTNSLPPPGPSFPNKKQKQIYTFTTYQINHTVAITSLHYKWPLITVTI